MITIVEPTIDRAWLAATRATLDNGMEIFNLIVLVTPGIEPTDETAMRSVVDHSLRARKLQDTQTVANTIFPAGLARLSAAAIYDTYRTKSFPVLRRLRQNQRGTYFMRLIANSHYPALNPLDEVVQKMRHEIERGRGIVRCAYELPVYDATSDGKMRMGFPCLSHISLKIDDAHLHLTALYRNQRQFERAYGNYLGLARLQRFICRETGLAVGDLVCHATHAELDLGRQKAGRLLDNCSAVTL